MRPQMKCLSALTLIATLMSSGPGASQDKDKNLPYVELEGIAETYQHYREWQSYYWRDDFTLLVRDGKGVLHRIITREPTPWNNLKLGTTYPGLKVDWKKKPKVKIIGVQGMDRIPEEFYDLKPGPKTVITAFIVRVWDPTLNSWHDFYINNWFHKWGPDTDAKVLAHYANNNPHYTVYGYLGHIAAKFDAKGQALVDKFNPDWSGIIYHARVSKVKDGPGYELEVLHLMGRNKKTLDYKVFFGDPAQLSKLEQNKPK